MSSRRSYTDLLTLARTGGLTFTPLRPGVDAAWLEPGPGASSAVLRYAPGASVPEHEHTGLEHVVILDGEQSDDQGTYRAGDVVINQTGSRHRVWSTPGCLALLIWERPVRFTGPG
jgi:anti-sigma factor ChrR (cupin superfamily)